MSQCRASRIADSVPLIRAAELGKVANRKSVESTAKPVLLAPYTPLSLGNFVTCVHTVKIIITGRVKILGVYP
jgi:hypothetical protein